MLLCILLFISVFSLIKEKFLLRLSISMLTLIYSFLWSVFLLKNTNVEFGVSDLFSMKNYSLKELLIVFGVNLLIGLIFFVVYNNLSNSAVKFKKKYIPILFVCFILLFLGFLIMFSARWTKDYFGNIGIEEIMYTLTQSLTGTDDTQVYDFILGPLVKALLFSFSGTLLCGYAISVNLKKTLKLRKGTLVFLCFSVGSILFFNLYTAINILGYKELKNYFLENSTLYETNFVDPQKIQIQFPEKKRNLIYIYVESLEASYTSKELGGIQDENLLPNLTRLAMTEGINFSNNEKIGGALQFPGLGFTVGGMVGESSGVPLKVTGGYNENQYGKTEHFMPGLTSLGDLLEEEGYRQILLIGSEATFSGRDKYYSQHGDFEIRDYSYAMDNGWIPEGYKVWWGYEDQKLFGFAKQTLEEISSSNEPFNLTILTADTHFPGGYMSDDTPKIFDKQYSNVIHYSDYLINEFISWVQQQPFYENTTIVLSGDHLTMDSDYFSDIDPEFQRTVFDLILNSANSTTNDKNRLFSTMDLFPTTLSALGVKIEGDRLGLGTDLFSSTPTLVEQFGVENMTEELSKGSKYYNNKIMQGSDLEVHIK